MKNKKTQMLFIKSIKNDLFFALLELVARFKSFANEIVEN